MKGISCDLLAIVGQAPFIRVEWSAIARNLDGYYYYPKVDLDVFEFQFEV